MSQDLVSVVMPVYNADATLRRSIESVLAQTYPRWELLMVNNTSANGTAD